MADNVQNSIDKLTEAMGKLRALMVENHDEVRRRLSTGEDHIIALYKRVEGKTLERDEKGQLSPVPPPKRKDPRVDNDETTPIPLEEHVSGHDFGLAAIDGRLIVLEGEVKQVKGHVTKTHDMQTAQTKAMGIGLSFFKYLGSKDGIKSIAIVIAAITGLLTVINQSYVNYKKFNATTTVTTTTHAP